jgi:hypothetical protein
VKVRTPLPSTSRGEDGRDAGVGPPCRRRASLGHRQKRGLAKAREGRLKTRVRWRPDRQRLSVSQALIVPGGERREGGIQLVILRPFPVESTLTRAESLGRTSTTGSARETRSLRALQRQL